MTTDRQRMPGRTLEDIRGRMRSKKMPRETLFWRVEIPLPTPFVVGANDLSKQIMHNAVEELSET
jgi:hypothetical protein